MKLRPTHFAWCLLFLAAIPAWSQRGNLGIDVGQVNDKFGAVPSTNDLTFNVNGEFVILKSKPKDNTPDLVAGGEIRLPSDSNSGAKEFMVYAGVRFHIKNLIIGADGQVHKMILPTTVYQNQVFIHDTIEVLEIAPVIRYKFGSGNHLFLEAKGAPEFSPRFKIPAGALVLPNPNLDHGYFVRGTVGYTYNHYFIRASYESRYFKFAPDAGNPNGLYNWLSNSITGGVGVTF
ncbi:MAG TPA: hypothetical protein VMH04_02820 [Candidatus Solibacter sp.]|nr:hypothetical protein [Candidatus Solibacter sp.]